MAMTKASVMTLEQYCPDMQTWPERWQFDEHDIAFGHEIVAFLKPFFLDLLTQGLAVKTLRRHRDCLWLLGGELIRERHENKQLKKMAVPQAIAKLIHEDGGPLIWPRITEGEQDSFDATCRRLYKSLSLRGHPSK